MFLKASYKYWDENAVRKWYYKENQSNNITTYKIVRDFRPLKISVGMSSILFPSNILKKKDLKVTIMLDTKECLWQTSFQTKYSSSW